MAWSTPLTAVSNATLTAAQWNASVRDNLLETAPAKASTAGGIFVATGTNAIAQRIPTGATIATSQNTGSAAYTDLTTPGPAVTVTTGTKAIVGLQTRLSNSSTANTLMSYAVSGASTIAADDGKAVYLVPISASSQGMAASALIFEDGLTAGSNTFTAKYKVTAGTGTWQDRRLFVIPL